MAVYQQTSGMRNCRPFLHSTCPPFLVSRRCPWPKELGVTTSVPDMGVRNILRAAYPFSRSVPYSILGMTASSGMDDRSHVYVAVTTEISILPGDLPATR
jgi:hypothetical protein